MIQPALWSVVCSLSGSCDGWLWGVKGQDSLPLPAWTGAILDLIKWKSKNSSRTRCSLICMPRDTNTDIDVAGALLRLLG